MTLTEKGAHTPTWTPFGEWTSTPERRRELALELANLARLPGMGDTVAVGLTELAGHLEDPERWERFEVLCEAVRDLGNAGRKTRRVRARVDAAVANLCEAEV